MSRRQTKEMRGQAWGASPAKWLSRFRLTGPGDRCGCRRHRGCETGMEPAGPTPAFFSSEVRGPWIENSGVRYTFQIFSA
jgi:hypothetical protein